MIAEAEMEVGDQIQMERNSVCGVWLDLVELVRAARDRGIRVIADLVVNHTSDEHP